MIGFVRVFFKPIVEKLVFPSALAGIHMRRLRQMLMNDVFWGKFPTKDSKYKHLSDSAYGHALVKPALRVVMQNQATEKYSIKETQDYFGITVARTG